MVIFSKMAESNNRKNAGKGKVSIYFKACLLRNWQDGYTWKQMRKSLG